MKNQISTTKEQSDRITACGVSPDLADMTIHLRGDCYVNEWNRQVAPITLNMPYRDARYLYLVENIVPAWSLSALLGLLPKDIDIDGYKYHISIYFESPDEPVIGNQWCLHYKPKKHYEKSRIDDVPMYAPDLIECAVLMAEWLTNNGYKLNER